jgi:integrase
MPSIAHQIYRSLSQITLTEEQIQAKKAELGCRSIKQALRPGGSPFEPLPFILGKGTYKTYFRTARAFFSYAKKDTGEREIGKLLSYEMIMKTFNAHYANAQPGTVYKIQAAIKKVYAGATILGWVRRPCPIDNELRDQIESHVRVPRYGYDPQDAKRILVYFQEKNSKYALAVEIAYRAALREDEIAGLKGTQVDRIHHLFCFKGKGGRYREVPVSSSLILKLPVTNGYFFTPKESWRLSLTSAVHRACCALGIEISGVHRLRSTRAQIWYTALRVRGRNDREARLGVSKLLGHNRREVTFHYIPKEFDWEAFIPYLDIEDEDLDHEYTPPVPGQFSKTATRQ